MLQDFISDFSSGVLLCQFLIKTEMIYKHEGLVDSQLE